MDVQPQLHRKWCFTPTNETQPKTLDPWDRLKPTELGIDA